MTPEQIEYRATLLRLIAMRELCREVFRKTLDPAVGPEDRPSRDQIQAANALLTHCRQDGLDLEILRQQDLILKEIAALRNPGPDETTAPAPPGERKSGEQQDDVPAELGIATTGCKPMANDVQGVS